MPQESASDETLKLSEPTARAEESGTRITAPHFETSCFGTKSENLPVPKPTTEPVFSEDWAWLENWKPHQPVPLARATLEAMKAKLERSLFPTGPQEMAIALDKLFKFARAFGISTEATEEATTFYAEALEKYPADLIAKAVDKVCASWRWGNKLPLPADLANEAAGEWKRRKSKLVDVKVAIGKRG